MIKNTKTSVTKEKTTIKKIVLGGLFIALVFLTTFLTRIPIPGTQGYFNLGDSVIMVAAYFFGGTAGFIAGAFGSALADGAAGYYIYLPVTFIVKGVEGFVVGWLCDRFKKLSAHKLTIILSFLVGAVIMIAGYFISESFILGLFDKNFGLTVAIGSLAMNIPQGLISIVIAYILSLTLEKTGFKHVKQGDRYLV